MLKIYPEIIVSLYTRASWLVNHAVLDRETYIAITHTKVLWVVTRALIMRVLIVLPTRDLRANDMSLAPQKRRPNSESSRVADQKLTCWPP